MYVCHGLFVGGRDGYVVRWSTPIDTVDGDTSGSVRDVDVRTHLTSSAGLCCLLPEDSTRLLGLIVKNLLWTQSWRDLMFSVALPAVDAPLSAGILAAPDTSVVAATLLTAMGVAVRDIVVGNRPGVRVWGPFF
jgi:hypothetical protein